MNVLLIEKEESIQLKVRLFLSGKKVHKEIKHFINLNTVNCCFLLSSASFGLMEDRNSFSTGCIIYECTHIKLMFFNQLLFLVSWMEETNSRYWFITIQWTQNSGYKWGSLINMEVLRMMKYSVYFLQILSNRNEHGE